jgi:hypothetical protein
MHGSNVCVIYVNVSAFTILGSISEFVLCNGDFSATCFLTFRLIRILTDALDTSRVPRDRNMLLLLTQL